MLTEQDKVIWYSSLDWTDSDSKVRAIISDYNWFNSNISELLIWIERHNVEQYGLSLIFPDQQTADWFTLTWL